ncbi:hypothetical protein [Clostridium ganghwense]|uniref:Uncharacterized protein n=1 Tax=Clostridium ganghwense TaxID=312089 RepID=A0ABT4CUP8_9CLOT|nr:hypothetical protein [Clostridium ganghwense]MCY6372799.1 hypothetical protein [Clostridium ganghwense]
MTLLIWFKPLLITLGIYTVICILILNLGDDSDELREQVAAIIIDKEFVDNSQNTSGDISSDGVASWKNNYNLIVKYNGLIGKIDDYSNYYTLDIGDTILVDLVTILDKKGKFSRKEFRRCS